jgi:transposase
MADPGRALPVLALIRELHAVESEIRNVTTTLRDRIGLGSILRPEKGRGILDHIEALLRRDADQVLPKSPIGNAIRYVLGQWDELCRFVVDGEIPIDNNATERARRTVGRHVLRAARNVQAAGQGKSPSPWLSDVLTRVRDHPAERMAELTPRIWTPAA